MSHYKGIIEDTTKMHREEVMKKIQALLDEQGAEEAEVVIMKQCPQTGKVIHESFSKSVK